MNPWEMNWGAQSGMPAPAPQQPGIGTAKSVDEAVDAALSAVSKPATVSAEGMTQRLDNAHPSMPWNMDWRHGSVPQSTVSTQNIRHGGWAANVRDAVSGVSAPQPLHVPSGAELGREWEDTGRGVAVGVPAGAVGLAGDMESLARHIAASVGIPVSTDTALPTSERMGDIIGGEAQSNEEKMGRAIGNFIGPGAAVKALRAGRVITELTNPIRGAGATDAARAAHDAGYVLTPTMASERPGVVSQVMAMMSGKIKLQQAASAANQETTNRLAAEALGLPGETEMSEHALSAVRDVASVAYKRVANSVSHITPDEQFRADVSSLGPRIEEAARAFPKLVRNDDIQALTETLTEVGDFSPQAGLELVRHLRADGSANLKAFDNPGRQALGLAQRHAADAVDNLMERSISDAGKPDVVNEYRSARQLLARSYDVETALNSANGDVSARIIGALAKKGRPVTDELKDIADAARAFPKAMQNPSTFGGTEGLGILDAGAAIMSHGATVPLSIARPGARSALLSPAYQKRLMRDPATATGINAVPALGAPSALNKAVDDANHE